MTTREIAEHLATAARAFPFLHLSDAAQLLEVVRRELGHENALDDFQRYGAHFAKATGPETILHVMSGNTPHAALQSVIRGLLLNAQNLCKLPSSGLPEVAEFRELLPPELARKVEVSSEWREDWLTCANAVIVFGDDETVTAIRAKVRPHQTFMAHGHAVSLGIIFYDPSCESAAGAARDASAFDQQGCLSPHVFYVCDEPETYAARLAEEMQRFETETPRRQLAASEAAQIARLREEFAFRAANGDAVRVFQSTESTAWTVLFDPESAFTASCLNRVVFVKPLPKHLPRALAPARGFISTIGIWPATLDNARLAAQLGASRICPIGRMQAPPVTWHQDGQQTLAPLVRWIDVEVP